MPLVKLNEIGEESAWALWVVRESEEELAYRAMESCPEEIVSKQKRLEWLAGKALIKTLVGEVGLEYLGLRKDEYGKPFLKAHPHQISLSHSFPYVAAQIHPFTPVGIDVEQPKEKLLKVASRVLSPAELQDAGTDIVKHCIYWCAKETMYKIYGKRGLHFENQLNIAPFRIQQQGELQGTITTDVFTSHVVLSYTVQMDYVLVYTNFSEA